MKRAILIHGILLTLILTLGCVGKEFTTKPEQKEPISNNTTQTTGGGGGSDLHGSGIGGNVNSGAGNAVRTDDYLECCILEYSCMMELEANRSSVSSGSGSFNRIPVTE